MSIKLRLMAGFLGIALLVGVTGAIGVLEQLQTSEQAAIVEAKNIGETIGLAVMAHDQENLQSFITRLHSSQQRDIEVVDLNKRILADAVLEDVDTVLTHDMGNEVGLTMQDGQVRTFVEISPEYPQGIRQLVVPLKSQEGKIIGAIIVEYTALYEELRSAAEATGRTIAAYTLACVILALALGYFISTSISGPILKLRDAAGQIEQGQLNVPLPRVGQDEIGQLVTSFAHMTDQLNQTLIGLEQRIAERTSALGQSEARFRGLFEHAPVSIWEEDFSAVRHYIDDLRRAGVVDLSDYFDRHPDAIAECAAQVKIVDVNLATLEMYQAESKTQLLVDLSKILGPEGWIPFKEEILALARGETAFENETTNYTLRGERRVIFLRLTVAPDYAQTWAKVFVGISDITKRRQAEAALRESEERFKLMAWATTDAVWDWDLQTNQIWWGEGLQKIFHYSSDTTQANPQWRLDHIHPEDRAKVERVINQTLEGGIEFWSKEYRFQRIDGTYADVMDRGYVIRNDAGKSTRMIGAMMDITERKYMESALLKSNEGMGQILNELQESNRDKSLLNKLSHLLQGCHSAKEAYGTIAELSKELFPRTAGALYLLNAERTQVSAIASWGELSPASNTFTPDNCKALRRGPTRPLNADQPGSCCLHFDQTPSLTYCLPIQVHGEILGIFHLQSTSEEYLTENKRQLAYSVIEQSEMALSNLKLRDALLEQSIRDPLTELYNRRYMEEALNQQLSRVTRQLHPLGLIMIDIDHFKNFNDAHGHAAGDTLLCELGRLLQSHIRGEDVACRYGGEEFLLIMPDASLEAAHQRAQQIQQEAKRLRVQDDGQSLDGITLSLGVAIYPEHGRSIDSVLRAADAALYRAKQEGRDRVAVADRAR